MSSSGDHREPATAHNLDLRGEVCPYTFVRTRLLLETLELGEVVRVVVDHEPATRNIPRSAGDWGQRVESVRAVGDGVWEIEIRRLV